MIGIYMNSVASLEGETSKCISNGGGCNVWRTFSLVEASQVNLVYLLLSVIYLFFVVPALIASKASLVGR